ncbi:MAG: M14-type cytosolic carboxypeptidase, partial [Sphingobium sp.]
MTLSISSSFDAGNIRVVSTDCSRSPWRAELEIVRDNQSDFYQWFHFRVAGAAGQAVELVLTNCGQAAYPGGWPGYSARISADRENWLTADTGYSDGKLTIRVEPDANALWVAYFAPYSMERHHDLVAWAAQQSGVVYKELGLTLDGQPLDMLTLGDGQKQIWL